MAALRPGRKPGYRHSDDMRTHIKTGILIKRLHDHVTSKTPVLDNSQVNAAKALLNKVLPDLSAVDAKHSGADGGAIVFQTVYAAKNN